MTSGLTIKADSGPALRFERLFRYERDGWRTYSIAMLNAPVTGRFQVSDMDSTRYAAYFAAIADGWRGWPGEKTLSSIKGDLTLRATADGSGTVALKVELQANEDWRLEGLLALKAGSLQLLARSARQFFGG